MGTTSKNYFNKKTRGTKSTEVGGRFFDLILCCFFFFQIFFHQKCCSTSNLTYYYTMISTFILFFFSFSFSFSSLPGIVYTHSSSALNYVAFKKKMEERKQASQTTGNGGGRKVRIISEETMRWINKSSSPKLKTKPYVAPFKSGSGRISLYSLVFLFVVDSVHTRLL